MPVTLKLQKVTSPIQDEDRAVIFYTKNYSYIFRDQYGRQLSFTRQEFENIRPSLEYAEERLLELQPNQGQARITTTLLTISSNLPILMLHLSLTPFLITG